MLPSTPRKNSMSTEKDRESWEEIRDRCARLPAREGLRQLEQWRFGEVRYASQEAKAVWDKKLGEEPGKGDTE